MASTGSFAGTLGAVRVASATKLRVTANLIHYGLSVAPPIITPDTGIYEEEAVVTMSIVTPGATIRFRLDGQTPTAADPIYGGPFSLLP